MNPDDEARLLLYVYGELAPDEREAIELRLAADPHLRHQLQQLEADLVRFDGAFDGPLPDAGFEARLWAKLEPQLVIPAASNDADQSSNTRRQLSSTASVRRSWRSSRRWGTGMAWAASLVLTLGLGLWLGRQTAPVEVAGGSALDGNRVLSAHLVDHLKATERVLLLATNDPASGELTQQLASELIESHRLYAAAAERAGRPQLAQALRQLEPALLELATAPEHTVDALLRSAIENDDLPFKARSAAWAVEAQLNSAPPRS